jgi:hypothetical protein
MTIKVGIIGSEGNMGRRYAAICKHLGFDSVGYDPMLKDSVWDGFFTDRSLSHIIITSPTDQHLTNLMMLRLGVHKHTPILCEKPIAKASDEYNKELMTNLVCLSERTFMVNNYSFTDLIPDHEGVTSYDYCCSGRDGLNWDCIQLIYLARGEWHLRNESPVWQCQINGQWVHRSSVDFSYIRMMKTFLVPFPGPNLWGPEAILSAHKKVAAFEQATRYPAGDACQKS